MCTIIYFLNEQHIGGDNCVVPKTLIVTMDHMQTYALDYLIEKKFPTLTLSHLLHCFLIHSLTCTCNDVLSSYHIRYSVAYLLVSMRFKCSNEVSLYNLPVCLFPQTSMSVRLLRAWMVGRVWMKWTSSLVSVLKTGLDWPVRALCQHVSMEL